MFILNSSDVHADFKLQRADLQARKGYTLEILLYRRGAHVSKKSGNPFQILDPEG